MLHCVFSKYFLLNCIFSWFFKCFNVCTFWFLLSLNKRFLFYILFYSMISSVRSLHQLSHQLSHPSRVQWALIFWNSPVSVTLLELNAMNPRFSELLGTTAKAHKNWNLIKSEVCARYEMGKMNRAKFIKYEFIIKSRVNLNW